MTESSFMNAMLRSRCEFSITLAASATLIDGARWMPAMTTKPYDGRHDVEGRLVVPETTLVMVSKRCALSPGLMRSGE